MLDDKEKEIERLLNLWNYHIDRFSGKKVVATRRTAIGSTLIKEGDNFVVSSVEMYWGTTPALQLEGLESKLWNPSKFKLIENEES